ncbi:hypothetical protein [Nostoc sp. FACHB-190]|uniref:hypothetical protein n=1 Tax=Nostoc sp. FACHB-190 TaxID=2692838 RepID=UPI001686FB97|nr:hypothetical protein [Nostoc sp. FACHB-190]MBD2300052.1 hypothetical protein [Nostoc sp. FACHB-190]
MKKNIQICIFITILTAGCNSATQPQASTASIQTPVPIENSTTMEPITTNTASDLIPIQSVAQAQSRPQFCQIYDGNLNQYVSGYNIDNLNQPTPTPYRPFIHNYQAYKITEQLIAKPLFYTALTDGNIVSAFQLKGIYGNLLITDKDVVVQHIKHSPINSYAEVLGLCINGSFVPPQKQEFYNIVDLPQNTQSALQEAHFGITTEQTGRMFK